MSVDNTGRLFVYGTLMPGEINHHYLQTIDGVWQRATIKGRLYPQGIGLATGYPALVLAGQFDGKEELVPGWLLTSEHLKNHWQVLDEFEGIAYKRVTTLVTTLDNILLEAYVYVLSESNKP